MLNRTSRKSPHAAQADACLPPFFALGRPHGKKNSNRLAIIQTPYFFGGCDAYPPLCSAHIRHKSQDSGVTAKQSYLRYIRKGFGSICLPIFPHTVKFPSSAGASMTRLPVHFLQWRPATQ